MIFVNATDFKGFKYLANIISTDRGAGELFEDLATEYEEDILRGALGDWLYTQLLADLDGNGTPQTPKYIDLVNGVTYVNSAGYTVIYKGFKRFLTAMIFEKYTIATHTENTEIGTVSSLGENSDKLPRNEMIKVKNSRFNEAIKFYNDLRRFLNDQETTYFENNEYSNWLCTFKVIKSKGLITRLSYSNQHYKNNI